MILQKNTMLSIWMQHKAGLTGGGLVISPCIHTLCYKIADHN